MSKAFPFTKLLSTVSKMMREEDLQEKKLNPQQQSHQLEIENAILVLAAAVIRCDRNFTSDTEKHITDYLNRQFGGRSKVKRLQSLQSHVDVGTEPFTKIACKELKLLTTYDSRLNIVHFLFGVAASDDFINARELRCIHRLSGYLGLPLKDFNVIKEEYTSKYNPYVLLGVEEGAAFEKVKSAYRKMILKFHPDKRGDKLTEEEANRKFREIQKAFELISKQLE
jgi:DnaJ like chaperone protein